MSAKKKREPVTLNSRELWAVVQPIMRRFNAEGRDERHEWAQRTAREVYDGCIRFMDRKRRARNRVAKADGGGR